VTVRVNYARTRSPYVDSGAEEVPSWRQRAACRDLDPEIWFPVGTGAVPQMIAERAKNVCRVCPVRTDCLDYSIDKGEKFGIWGGLDEDERAAEIRHRNATARQSSKLELAAWRFTRAQRLRAAGLQEHEIAEEMRVNIRTVQRYLEAAR
jgi:WhiB family redox-sensing transcriptional regulator